MQERLENKIMSSLEQGHQSPVKIIFLFVWNCTEELIRGVSVITHTLDLDLDFMIQKEKEKEKKVPNQSWPIFEM